MNKIQREIDCAVIELLSNGIIKVDYRPDFEVELNDVKEVEKVFIDLSGGDNIYCLMDLSGQFNVFTNEAQKYLSNEALIVTQGIIKGSAVVIDNLPNRLFAKFFIKFFKPPFLTQAFSNSQQAVEWLLELMKKNE